MFGPPHKGAGVLVGMTVGAEVTADKAEGSPGGTVQTGGRACDATGSAGPNGLVAKVR